MCDEKKCCKNYNKTPGRGSEPIDRKIRSLSFVFWHCEYLATHINQKTSENIGVHNSPAFFFPLPGEFFNDVGYPVPDSQYKFDFTYLFNG
jgi:hypothetical protein